MAIKRWCVVTVAALGALAASVPVRAQDLTAPPSDARTPSIRSDDVGTAESLQKEQAQVDDASSVTDLESTRAALDHRGGPAVSLSVSGWVAEQVVVHTH